MREGFPLAEGRRPACRVAHDARRWRMRGLSIAALVVQMLVCPKAGESQNRVKRVTIDLAGPTIDSVLPFDERFLLVGPVSDSVTRVAVRYWKTQDSLPHGTATFCGGAPPDADSTAWNRLQSVTSTQFALLVGPLDADQKYVFCFHVVTKPTAQQIQLFQFAVADSLDTATRVRPSTTRSVQEVVTAAVDGLCPTLPTLFDPMRPLTSVRARSGSLLDCTRVNLLRHLLQLAKLLDYTGARWNAQSAATRASSQALRGLRSIAAGPAGALGRAAQAVAAVPEAKAYVALADRVQSLDDGAMGALAEGRAGIAEPETAGLVPIDAAWAPADLAPRILNLGRLELALDSLRGLASLASQQATPRTRQEESTALTQWRAGVGDLAAYVRQEEDELRRMSAALASRRVAIDTAAHQLAVAVSEDVALEASTTADFVTRGGWYISANVGLAFFPTLGEVSPIVGANFYFTPVNRDVPLRPCEGYRRRISLVIALTTGSMSRTGQRDDLFASRGLVVGIGYRISDILQLSAGALLLKAPDRDPAVDHSTIRFTPYAAVAIDATLSKLLGTFTSAIFK